MGTTKLCRYCRKYRVKEVFPGYYKDNEIKCPGKCPKCRRQLEDTGIEWGEYLTINVYSTDPQVFDYMMELKKNDLDKYKSELTRMDKDGEEQIQRQYEERLKEKLKKQKEEELKAKENEPKCPKCGCTNIQLVPRKWSLLTGFLTNKVDRICVNCKYKF